MSIHLQRPIRAGSVAVMSRAAVRAEAPRAMMVAVKVIGLEHVQLAMPAGHEGEATAFYEGVLGIPRVSKPAHLAARGGCWFESSALKVHLGVEGDFKPATKAHPAFIVSDVRLLARDVAAAGYDVVDDEPLDGYDRVYVFDPFGNRIELMQPLATPAGTGGPSAHQRNSPMAVRDLTNADRQAATTLWAAVGLTRPWNDAGLDFDRALAGPTSSVLGAVDEDVLVATVMVGHDGHRGWVYYLAVSPALRGRGLGRHMMGAAEAWLADAGAVKLNLMVRHTNQEALGFYERLGYVDAEVAVRARWLEADLDR